MSTALEVVALNKSYQSNGKTFQAVDNLSMTASAGEVLAFLGPNGAGKTTTIKMICGLITPTSGQVCLNGYDMARQTRLALRQVSAVLEGTRNIYWRLTAMQNLMYFGRLRAQPNSKLKPRAEYLLKELNLWDRRNDRTQTFSRGMQQKVAIACAIVSDPPIILLDEPTLGLDVEAARTVEQWVLDLAHKQGKTVVLTTHQLDMAQRISDRVAIINKGKLIADQPVDKLLGLFQQEAYQVKVAGALTQDQIAIDGFTLTTENEETTLTGTMSDPKLLYDLIDKLRGLNARIISINRTEPDLEEVFMRLLKGKHQ